MTQFGAEPWVNLSKWIKDYESKCIKADVLVTHSSQMFKPSGIHCEDKVTKFPTLTTKAR